MNKIKVIDVGEFSLTPGGAKRVDGPFSGEEFLEDYIMPALKENDYIIIDLESPVGFTTSFLKEVFEGIVNKLKEKALDRVSPRAINKYHRAEKALRFMKRALNN